MFPLPHGIEHLASARPGSILLETSLPDSENRFSYLFLDPEHILIPSTLNDIPDLFREIENLLIRGYFIAGAVSYECGYHFEPRGALRVPDIAAPLAWFGAYKRPCLFDHQTGQFDREPPPFVLPADDAQPAPPECDLALGVEDYCEKIQRIRDYIAAGDTYQVNFTTRAGFNYSGSAVFLYTALRRRQKVPYAAFIHAGDLQVLSFSPELFFRLSGNHILTRPMKGTAPRGVNLEDDRRVENWLRNDPKNQSENVMIVDLLRNDLGRIAEPGSVQVERLFDVQKYETLFQMTSTIRARLRPATSFYDLFRAIFPSGSVTGAPKPRTMQIIQELEGGSRGVYTGAIGYISPAREAAFSVPIRTLVLRSGHGEMRVGSGIVYDASAVDEYEECRLKMHFLARQQPEFELIETLRWDSGYCRLREHLKRLRASAEYFDFSCPEAEILARLERYSAGLVKGTTYRVRFLLARTGEVSVSSQELSTAPEDGSVALAGCTTSSGDRFLYHKTTNRDLYDRKYREALRAGHVDVLFTNERGEITEGTIHNVFLAQGSHLYTPPLSCGLLPGIYRAHVLATNPNAREKVLRTEDLLTADAIYLCNSVRGMRRVRLVCGTCE